MRGFGRAAASALVALTLVAGSGAAAIAAPASMPTAIQMASLPTIPSLANPYLDGNRSGIGDDIMVYSYVFKPQDVTYTYQWYRDAKPIAGDIAFKHKFVAADKGRPLYAVVTGHKAGYADTALKSGTMTFDFVYRFSAKPSIWTTNPIVGTTYQADTGYREASYLWGTRPDNFTYQWNLDGKPVKGATNPTYKVVSADYGKRLSVTVTAHAHGYTPATNASAQTNTIKMGYATYKKALYVTGKSKVGSTLGVTDGQWLSGAKLSYQWYYLVDNNIGWKPISGATKSTYKIDSKYAGKRIYAQVTGSKAGYISSSAWSGWSGVIAR